MFPLPNYNTAATEAAIFPDHAVLFEVEAGKNSLGVKVWGAVWCDGDMLFRRLFSWEEKDFLLPEDYEPCGECGFDHDYEFEAAKKCHLPRAD